MTAATDRRESREDVLSSTLRALACACVAEYCGAAAGLMRDASALVARVDERGAFRLGLDPLETASDVVADYLLMLDRRAWCAPENPGAYVRAMYRTRLATLTRRGRATEVSLSQAIEDIAFECDDEAADSFEADSVQFEVLRSWCTKAELALLIAFYGGRSYSELARMHGTTRAAMIKRVQRLQRRLQSTARHENLPKARVCPHSASPLSKHDLES